jgi:hypothetical protein
MPSASWPYLQETWTFLHAIFPEPDTIVRLQEDGSPPMVWNRCVYKLSEPASFESAVRRVLGDRPVRIGVARHISSDNGVARAVAASSVWLSSGSVKATQLPAAQPAVASLSCCNFAGGSGSR